MSLVPPLLEDTGQYVCTAVNDIGTDVSAVNISVTGQQCQLCQQCQ